MNTLQAEGKLDLTDMMIYGDYFQQVALSSNDEVESANEDFSPLTSTNVNTMSNTVSNIADKPNDEMKKQLQQFEHASLYQDQ